MRALARESDKLWEQSRNLGWVELEKPVMRGWKRFFVLRQDVAEGPYAEFFQGILDKVNTFKYSPHKDFRVKKKRLKKWKYNIQKQELQKLDDWQFNRMKFSELEKRFFEERLVLNKHKQWVKVFVFTEAWRFVLKVRPNMITQTRVRSAETDSRIEEIDNHLLRNNLNPRLAKIKGHDHLYSYRGWRRRYRDDFRTHFYEFKNMPLPQILDAIKQESY